MSGLDYSKNGKFKFNSEGRRQEGLNQVKFSVEKYAVVIVFGIARVVSDAAWSQLRKWIEYFGLRYGRLTVAVPPHYTTSDCPSCGKRVKKSLSTRTHVCDCGIPVLDRDYAASLNILKKATQGHWGSWSNEMLDLNAWGDSTSILVGGNTCQSKSSH